MLIQETNKGWITLPGDPEFKNDIMVVFIDGSTHPLGELIAVYKSKEKPKADEIHKDINKLWDTLTEFYLEYNAHQHLDIQNMITSKPHKLGDAPLKTWAGEHR